MADLLLDLIERLKDAQLVLGDGIDSFRDTMPDSPNNVISLVEYPGTNIPHLDLSVRNIQINVRSTSYADARTKIYDIYRYLNAADCIFDKDRTGRWFVGTAKQPPFKLKVDTEERVIFTFNYALTSYND